MFNKFNLVAGILALTLFGYGQSQGWNLFENVANSGGSSGGSGGSRIYHK
ncbi:MAG: hypothetical protein H6R10_2860 [Rhodocyclaceae bacterium]|nr:hypothetical protein [Rhodocyclaceae bacterium]